MNMRKMHKIYIGSNESIIKSTTRNNNTRYKDKFDRTT